MSRKGPVTVVIIIYVCNILVYCYSLFSTTLNLVQLTIIYTGIFYKPKQRRNKTPMTFDNIIANPPYSKIGCDITKYILNNVSYRDISMLGTRTMFRKHNDVLNIEYVYIKDWALNPLSKLKWVEQVILLGYKGHCEVVPAKLSRHHCPEQPNEIRVPFPMEHTGSIHISLNYLLTRSRKTSCMLCLSDEDYEYIKTHWDNMTSIERFWWLYDKGLYAKYSK